MIEAVCLIGLQIRAYKGSDYKSDPAALNNIGAHPEEQGLKILTRSPRAMFVHIRKNGSNRQV